MNQHKIIEIPLKISVSFDHNLEMRCGGPTCRFCIKREDGSGLSECHINQWSTCVVDYGYELSGTCREILRVVMSSDRD